MLRPLATLGTALAAALVLLGAVPALACEKEHGAKKEQACSCPHHKAKAEQAAADEVESALSAKCSCEGTGDCTCKKGQCECKKCGGHHQRTELLERLDGKSAPLKIPQNARYDATAGVFI
ncbi:MAG: metallothionein [Myxococcota bacterium]